jgi:ArsR family transcriptional regulator, lead/cadmium/zinc/bismuth-responsive transcriptional repressor
MPIKRIAALREEVHRQDQVTALASLMNAVGNDTRMRILYLLWRNGEVRVNDLAAILNLTTPAVSQQLKKLRKFALVRTRRDAQTIYYRLDSDSDVVLFIVSFFESGTLMGHHKRN